MQPPKMSDCQQRLQKRLGSNKFFSMLQGRQSITHIGNQDMSKSSQDFRGVIKFFGPLAALQLVVFVVPALFLKDNYSLLAAFQFSGVLAITALAAGTGYKAGKRGALNEPRKEDAKSEP